jgi:cation diffusion facilitator CzcD-associated flavoprotein CzcO
VSATFPAKPRIAIVGAGALGCYYGARLAKAGNEVHFLVRSGRAAIMARGIRVKTPAERFHLKKVLAHATAEDIGPCDLVIVSVKATANDALARILPPLIGPKHPRAHPAERPRGRGTGGRGRGRRARARGHLLRRRHAHGAGRGARARFPGW